MRLININAIVMTEKGSVVDGVPLTHVGRLVIDLDSSTLPTEAKPGLSWETAIKPKPT